MGVSGDISAFSGVEGEVGEVRKVSEVHGRTQCRRRGSPGILVTARPRLHPRYSSNSKASKEGCLRRGHRIHQGSV